MVSGSGEDAAGRQEVFEKYSAIGSNIPPLLAGTACRKGTGVATGFTSADLIIQRPGYDKLTGGHPAYPTAVVYPSTGAQSLSGDCMAILKQLPQAAPGTGSGLNSANHYAKIIRWVGAIPAGHNHYPPGAALQLKAGSMATRPGDLLKHCANHYAYC